MKRRRNAGQFKRGDARTRELSQRGVEARAGVNADQPPTRKRGGTPETGTHTAAQFSETTADPADILRELMTDKRNPAGARTLAAKALANLEPDQKAQEAWRESVQVRDDYRPPSNLDLYKLGVKLEAVSAAETVESWAELGRLEELRKAVEAAS